MAAFTAGNIVVYRVGGTATDGAGTAALTSAATQVFLDEYTPAGVYVQSIALPTTTSGANDALTDSGTATSDGLITTAGNGSSILVAGYDAPVGTAGVTGTSAAADPRVVGIVSANGTVDTSTVATGYSSGNNFRSVASADGTNLYLGANAGAGYTTADSTAAPAALDTVNTRQVEVAGGQLYYSTGSGTAGIYALGSGTPTSGTQTPTLIAASASPYSFAFEQLNANGAGFDTLYVADATNGLEKFSLVNGSYVATGTVALSGVTGVTATVSGNTVTLYATTPTGIEKLVDSSGFDGTLSGTPTVIATAPTNTAFRGDALAPAAACYAAGTLIRTAKGDVAIEALEVGDLVVTASGAHRPILWLGHRKVDCVNAFAPEHALPIRIAAHAFAPNEPARDLFVSPGHSICVDLVGEVLIPAWALVNGTTVAQIDVEQVTYWHLELEEHDIVLAENLASESYLEMGNRGFFSEGAVVSIAALPDAPATTHADFCRPFHAIGRLVDIVRDRLILRADALAAEQAALVPLARIA